MTRVSGQNIQVEVLREDGSRCYTIDGLVAGAGDPSFGYGPITYKDAAGVVIATMDLQAGSRSVTCDGSMFMVCPCDIFGGVSDSCRGRGGVPASCQMP
jgi:hypothetical protein